MIRFVSFAVLLEVVWLAAGDQMAFTCSKGSAEAKYPYCDTSKGFRARAQDLVGRMTQDQLVDLFWHSYPGTKYIPELNVKGWGLDHTCIHGVNKQSGVTVFPHAIAQGASFDMDLVTRISNATAVEARILSYQRYQQTRGTSQGSVLSCDGGPLANSAHDPRWGRISETYGEDPYVIREMGVRILQALQQPTEVPQSKGDFWMATRQVTRHFLGYHGARPDLGPYNAIMNVSQRSMADSYLPTYEAFQRPERGFADGIMCAMTEVNGVPSCGNPYLLKTLLRDTWNSDALVQTDCCDSMVTMNNPFHYQGMTTDTEAVKLAVDSGVQVYYGFRAGELTPDFLSLLANGSLKQEQLTAAAERIVLSQMRLGLFDTETEGFPFTNASTPWSMLDSPQHRALAREAAGKSTVLLKNTGVLPLDPSTTQSIAVIGPFAVCPGSGKEQAGTCYLHSYNGNPTKITSILQGIEGAAPKATVSYSLGSNITCDGECWRSGPAAAAIAEAVQLAQRAGVVVLAVGLGSETEAEGKDRVNMTLPPVQQALQEAVQKVAKTLVLVSVSAGGVDLDEEKAQAVLYAPYGGEEAGSGLADVLFGAVNPSAKLPLTVYKQAWADVMNANYSTSIAYFDLELGVGRTHRYIKDESLVKHHFGFGLSYTTFAYSGLSVQKQGDGLKVTVTVTNSGRRSGADVAQVYVSGAKVSGLVTPVHNLVGFRKVSLEAGKSTTLDFVVQPDELETAMEDGTRKIAPGTYTVWCGGHQPQDKEGEAVSGPVTSATVTL